MSVIDEIGDYLTAQGLVGGATGWSLVKGDVPASPDQMVTLTETAGEASDPAYPLSRERFQVRVRGAERHAGAGAYTAARDKIQALRVALHGLINSTLGAVRYVQVLEVASPAHLGYDANGRPEFVQTFATRREA